METATHRSTRSNGLYKKVDGVWFFIDCCGDWIESAEHKSQGSDSALVLIDGKQDNVNHPKHYQSDNGIECIDAIRAALGKEGFIAYCKGNAIKYTWRDKIDNREDMQKAQWYLNRADQEMGK
tara:strand:- start:3728 stop:4096 length:369 start_codon:yes stop_codon:yes gene_type:complete